MILLALAVLSVMRPGYAPMIDGMAHKFSGEVMLREFQKYNVHLNTTPEKTPADAKLFHGGKVTWAQLRENAGLPPFSNHDSTQHPKKGAGEPGLQ